jgi:glycosyltransferase involved in cell wall biosynthesis
MYNVECILRAFRIVRGKFPQAILGIAGAGSEESRLRERVREWQLKGVRFYGTVPHRQLPALYAEHDIFVNASNVDNFPGALLEAACSGLPIVTTRAGGIPDMIRDHETGLLVNLNDHEALANGVLECLEEQDLARNLARRARTWVEQFAWANIFPKLMECYGLPPAVGSREVLQQTKVNA